MLGYPPSNSHPHWLRASLAGVNPSSLPCPSQEHTCGLRTLGAAARSTPAHGTPSIHYTRLQPEQVTASNPRGPLSYPTSCVPAFLLKLLVNVALDGQFPFWVFSSFPAVPSHQHSLVAVHPMGGSRVRK